jgi:hypothetical protein
VLEITLAMARLHEYVAMGRFVPHLDDETLTACLERLSDEDLLRVAFVFEGKQAHARIFKLLGVARMRGALRSGGAAGLSDEASYLRERLSASQRKQLSGRAEV